MKKSILLTSLVISCFVTQVFAEITYLNLTLNQLTQVCSRYPENAVYPPHSFLTDYQLTKLTQQCTAVSNLNLKTKNFWLRDSGSFSTYHSFFSPYVQKLMVKPESNVYFFGDLHGNVHSLLRSLNHLKDQKVIDDNFRVIQPDTYLVFLGDYVDRGLYGIEVIYTLMRLRMINSQHVFLIRGNHEDVRLNNQYGFRDELWVRVDADAPYFDALKEWYNSMPLALFIGVKNGSQTDYIQCCHGGPELGFDAKELLTAPDHVLYQLLGTLNRADNVRNVPLNLKNDLIKHVPEFEIENERPQSPTHPFTIGFMWSDLMEDTTNYKSPVVGYNWNRGWVFGKDLTHYWFKQQSGPTHTLHAIIRGHQHYGDMLKQLIANKGHVNLWDDTAYTILSAPIPGKNFPYDAYTHLKTADKFGDWLIKPVVVGSNE